MESLSISAMSESGEKTIRVVVKRWEQDKKGVGLYTPTDDLVAFPRLLKVKNGINKVIRVSYKVALPLKNEKTYRLYLEEIPSKRSAEDTGIRFIFNISIPVYAYPLKAITENTFIENISFGQEALIVTLKNEGNAHFSVGSIELNVLDSKLESLYKKKVAGLRLLSGNRVAFSIPFPLNFCQQAETIRVTAAGAEEFAKTILTKTLPINKDACSETSPPTTTLLTSPSQKE